jgi:predicted transcriptional regulator
LLESLRYLDIEVHDVAGVLEIAAHQPVQRCHPTGGSTPRPNGRIVRCGESTNLEKASDVWIDNRDIMSHSVETTCLLRTEQMASKKLRDVTDAELAVLQVLWEQGAATVREITGRVYPSQSESDYATVKKLLARLEAKKCVRRDRSRSVHSFSARVGRDDLIGRRLQDVADALCEGSWTPLLTHVVGAQELTARQQQMLADLIDELERKQPTARPQGDER